MGYRFFFVLFALFVACVPSGKKTEVALDLKAGQAIYENTCKSCHGTAGGGNIKFMAPALANLDDWYLIRELNHYRNGVRGYDAKDTLGQQMAAMAKTLKDTVAVRNVVAYIQSIPNQNVREQLVGNWKNGESIYQSLCGSCHGAEGKGNRKLDAPALNGLDSWYLKNQFEKFKNGTRGSHVNDKFGAQMVSIVALIKYEESLRDVIAYLRSDLKMPAK